MPVSLRITSLAPTILLALACGCAADSPPSRTPLVSPALAPPVRYSDVRPADLIPPAPGEYRVRPGDVLEIAISDLVGPGVVTRKVVRVGDSGTISLPLIGYIKVAGLTENEISQLFLKMYH